jgi:hypothetical protein
MFASYLELDAEDTSVPKCYAIQYVCRTKREFYLLLSKDGTHLEFSRVPPAQYETDTDTFKNGPFCFTTEDRRSLLYNF